LHRMLSERSAQLASTLARVGRGREYALRVYRVDAEMLAATASLSPRLAALASTAAAASPGQRYLLERKLDTERKTEMRAVTLQLVDEIVAALAPHAVASARSPIPKSPSPDAAATGTMILNAAFLVAPASLEAFQRTLTTLVERHGPHGLRFDFTGPWPPYHFVSDATNGA
jgi:gas vesicle protein GvpL/GvpF